MTAPTLTVTQLRNGLKTLPQELYDQVFALTFTINNEITVLDENYKPPAQLQVSSHTRKEFLKIFYGGTSWRILAKTGPSPSERSERYNKHLFSAWFGSLSKDAVNAIIGIQRYSAAKLGWEILFDGDNSRFWDFVFGDGEYEDYTFAVLFGRVSVGSDSMKVEIGGDVIDPTPSFYPERDTSHFWVPDY